MENASKALLIAAGVLVGIILISMFLFTYTGIKNYYTAKEKNKQIEQIGDFNQQYLPYDRDDVRGTDIISLVNKIIDFNTLYEDEENIEISIKIPEESVKNFYYNYEENKNIKLIEIGKKYTEKNIGQMLNVAKTIESKYPKGMSNKLANNISVLFIKDETKARNRKAYLEELKVSDTGDELTQDILKYYQYVQFKRAHFDCENLKYSQGRVKKFEFIFNGTFE